MFLGFFAKCSTSSMVVPRRPFGRMEIGVGAVGAVGFIWRVFQQLEIGVSVRLNLRTSSKRRVCVFARRPAPAST